ncbi:guanine nucleotide-binding protein [Cystoisospora suis]|uniref:Guanine nucleotide-binding protein n=1 Tax=Cystoisospora suis TaxID=483139 RepID=A0A2C6KU60_9APIC|nr:guanine nucleotide-binding protein [Cystoisospora suis]
MDSIPLQPSSPPSSSSSSLDQSEVLSSSLPSESSQRAHFPSASLTPEDALPLAQASLIDAFCLDSSVDSSHSSATPPPAEKQGPEEEKKQTRVCEETSQQEASTDHSPRRDEKSGILGARDVSASPYIQKDEAGNIPRQDTPTSSSPVNELPSLLSFPCSPATSAEVLSLVATTASSAFGSSSTRSKDEYSVSDDSCSSSGLRKRRCLPTATSSAPIGEDSVHTPRPSNATRGFRARRPSHSHSCVGSSSTPSPCQREEDLLLHKAGISPSSGTSQRYGKRRTKVKECLLRRREKRWRENDSLGNNIRGAEWSIDGNAFLTWNDDSIVRLFACPGREEGEEEAGCQLQKDDSEASSSSFSSTSTRELHPWTSVNEGELIFQCAWYPRLDWSQPSTFSYAVASRDHPIHLYSGVDSSLLSSYSCFNHLDEITHGFSLAFHPSQPYLLVGAISGVRLFHLERPGRQMKDMLFATRRARQGQKGIISCVDYKREGPSADKLFACGSYSQSVCTYTADEERRHKNCRQQVPIVKPVHSLLDEETLPWGGVTQVKFVGEYLLVSGHRQDDTLRCWDLRMPYQPLLRLFRKTSGSSQRFSFDFLPPHSAHIKDRGREPRNILVTGDETGEISFFDLTTAACISKIPHLYDQRKQECQFYGSPMQTEDQHENKEDRRAACAVVVATCHPADPLLLTASSPNGPYLDFRASRSSSFSSSRSTSPPRSAVGQQVTLTPPIEKQKNTTWNKDDVARQHRSGEKRIERKEENKRVLGEGSEAPKQKGRRGEDPSCIRIWRFGD